MTPSKREEKLIIHTQRKLVLNPGVVWAQRNESGKNWAKPGSSIDFRGEKCHQEVMRTLWEHDNWAQSI